MENTDSEIVIDAIGVGLDWRFQLLAEKSGCFLFLDRFILDLSMRRRYGGKVLGFWMHVDKKEIRQCEIQRQQYEALQKPFIA